MRLAFAAALLASCNTVPWLATDREVEAAIQTNQHEDQSFTVKEVAKVVAAARQEGIALTSYIPGEPIALPPPVDQGTDWANLLVLGITALTGSAGALGYRAIDHKRKAARAKA